MFWCVEIALGARPANPYGISLTQQNVQRIPLLSRSRETEGIRLPDYGPNSYLAYSAMLGDASALICGWVFLLPRARFCACAVRTIRDCGRACAGLA